MKYISERKNSKSILDVCKAFDGSATKGFFDGHGLEKESVLVAAWSVHTLGYRNKIILWMLVFGYNTLYVYLHKIGLKEHTF